MAKIENTHTCEYCNHTFKWEAILRQNLSATKILDVEDIREDYVHPATSFYNNDKFVILRCYCPKCDKSLSFTYDLSNNSLVQ